MCGRQLGIGSPRSSFGLDSISVSYQVRTLARKSDGQI